MAFETFLLIPNTYSHKKGIWIRVLGSKEAGGARAVQDTVGTENRD